MGDKYYNIKLHSTFVFDKALDTIRNSFLEQLKDYQGRYSITSLIMSEKNDQDNVLFLSLSSNDPPILYIPETKCNTYPNIIISAPHIEKVSFIKDKVCKQLMNNDDYDNDRIYVSMVSWNNAGGYAFSIGFAANTDIPKLYLFGSKEDKSDE